MKRLNFTLDNSTVELLKKLAEKYYSGNKSQTVRAALESLAAHQGHEGWVISGYTPVRTDHEVNCHSCGTEHSEGNILFRPVFEKGNSQEAIQRIPNEEWVECSLCVENHTQ
jgi:ferredoxin